MKKYIITEDLLNHIRSLRMPLMLADKLFAIKPIEPLTDKLIESVVDSHTTDDAGFDIWCDGRAVARAIERHIIGESP